MDDKWQQLNDALDKLFIAIAEALRLTDIVEWLDEKLSYFNKKR